MRVVSIILALILLPQITLAAVSADGTANGYAQGGSSTDYQFPGDFTIAFWVKTTATNQFLMTQYTRSTGNMSIYAKSGAGDCSTTNVNLMSATAISGGVLCAPTTSTIDGNWHSIIISRSGSTVSYYIDNGTPTTGTASGTTFNNGSDTGANYTINQSYGGGGGPNATTYYAKYAIYKGTAWSSGDRSAFHTSCTQPASPTAQWNFASGSLNTDSSGNGHTLTPGGTGSGWVYSSDEPTACSASGGSFQFWPLQIIMRPLKMFFV